MLDGVDRELINYGRQTDDGTRYVGLSERMAHRMAPACDWTDMGPAEHFIQFFESDSYLISQVSEYLIHGLKAGETCIVVATDGHLRGIEKKIRSFGFDPDCNGSYLPLDAHDTLARISDDHALDEKKFSQVIGELVGTSGERGKGVRIFGEMVGVLCSRGKFEAAIELEGFWNRLRRSCRFSLFCGYSMSDLSDGRATECMAAICESHSCVVPTESYSSITSTNERLKHIALLQQRTKQLETELAELEKRMSEKRKSPAWAP